MFAHPKNINENSVRFRLVKTPTDKKKGIIYNGENLYASNYMFPIYDKAVSIIFPPLKGNSVEFNNKVQKILSSIKIDKTEKKILANINKQDGDFFIKSKVIGEVFSTLLILGLFIWLIIYIVKKNSRS